VVAAFPGAASTLNQLNGRDLRELIVQNEAVRAAMAEWLTALRPQLINAHEQYQYLRFLMWPEYERAGLPEALLFAIMARESGGRVHAISTAGAAGLMQFMPATGRRFGLGWQDGYDTRFEPQLASRASTQYLNERFAELGHQLEFALAAYNGGEGRVGRLVRANPGSNYWDPAVQSALPKETRDYVPYVLAAAWLFLHPEDYGLEFSTVNGAATVLALKQPASINQLTICVGNGGTRYGYFRALRNLNPRWLPETELPAGTELRVPVAVVPLYESGCVSGTRAEQALALVRARKPAIGTASRPNPPAASTASPYTVRSGDTLSAIARRHGCNAQTMARANGLRSPYALRPGQRLSLSGCRS
jgi:membrane-bound lytic murein transglycosylase D